MSGRAATLIGTGFALLWLWLGSQALASPWSMLIGCAGTILPIVIAVQAMRRPAAEARRFVRSRYRLAVLGELAGFAFVAWWLSAGGDNQYLWPAVGIVVGVHFLGLWWASGRKRFVALSGVMTGINVFALTLPAEHAMAVSGLGSAAALAMTLAWP